MFPAISYLGQLILDKYPGLMDLNLPSAEDSKQQLPITPEEEYNGLSNLRYKHLFL